MARERDHPPVAPLILTAELDAVTMDRLDTLRRRHFPPGRNVLRAHLTLFHQLPAGAPIERAQAPLPATVDRVLKLGRGVAYGIHCPDLVALRARIADGLDLTPQDRGWGRPHVTVQNKVEPAVAAALHAELSAGFEPWAATVTGLRLWHYRGGPWELAEDLPFA